MLICFSEEQPFSSSANPPSQDPQPQASPWLLLGARVLPAPAAPAGLREQGRSRRRLQRDEIALGDTLPRGWALWVGPGQRSAHGAVKARCEPGCVSAGTALVVGSGSTPNITCPTAVPPWCPGAVGYSCGSVMSVLFGGIVSALAKHQSALSTRQATFGKEPQQSSVWPGLLEVIDMVW